MKVTEVRPFHECLAQALKVRDMSMAELSRKSGVSYPGIMKLKAGQREPKRSTFLQICKALDCHLGELV